MSSVLTYWYEKTTQYNSNLDEYNKYFQEKLKNLQDSSNSKIQQIKERKNKFAGKFNNIDFVLDEKKIASSAMSQLQQFNVNQNLESLYSAVKSTATKAGFLSDQYVNSLGALLKIKNGLSEGYTYSVKSKDISFIEQKLADGNIAVGQLSNLIGDLGQHTSSLAGAAITNAVVSQLCDQLNVSSDSMAIKASYLETGEQKRGTYRLQTDNALSISIMIDGMEGELNFSFNISDKANLRLGNLTKKKTTGSLKFRDSTVQATTTDLMEAAKYNTISYHWLADTQKRVSGMWSKSGNSLQHYIGYKMLRDMLLLSKEYEDSIDFTVYGGTIIPEETVIEKLLSKKRGSNDNYQYQANIAYYKLLNGTKSAVSSEEEAIKVINKMKVTIRASLNLTK